MPPRSSSSESTQVQNQNPSHIIAADKSDQICKVFDEDGLPETIIAHIGWECPEATFIDVKDVSFIG